MKDTPSLLEFSQKFLGLKPQPYQKQLIELIQKGKKPMIRLRPPASYKLALHKKHLLDEIMDADLTVTKRLTTMIIIDDPIAPHRSETK